MGTTRRNNSIQTEQQHPDRTATVSNGNPESVMDVTTTQLVNSETEEPLSFADSLSRLSPWTLPCFTEVSAARPALAPRPDSERVPKLGPRPRSRLGLAHGLAPGLAHGLAPGLMPRPELGFGLGLGLGFGIGPRPELELETRRAAPVDPGNRLVRRFVVERLGGGVKDFYRLLMRMFTQGRSSGTSETQDSGRTSSSSKRFLVRAAERIRSSIGLRLRAVGKDRHRLAVLERIPLAPRQSLTLVEAEGQRLLVATSAQGTATFFRLAGEGRVEQQQDESRPVHRGRLNRRRSGKLDGRVSW